jgi:hypothetical protein
MNEIVEESGLVALRRDWMKPRQSWFVAAHPNAEGDIDDLSRRHRRFLPEVRISGVLRTRPVGNPRKAREGRDYLREASVFWYRLVGPRR